MHYVRAYEAAALWLQIHAPQSDKFVHLNAGLALWLLAAWLTRRGLRSPVPLLIVAAAEAVNESIDRVAHGTWAWPDTIGDASATLFWPLLICWLLNRSRRIRT